MWVGTVDLNVNMSCQDIQVQIKMSLKDCEGEAREKAREFDQFAGNGEGVHLHLIVCHQRSSQSLD